MSLKVCLILGSLLLLVLLETSNGAPPDKPDASNEDKKGGSEEKDKDKKDKKDGDKKKGGLVDNAVPKIPASGDLVSSQMGTLKTLPGSDVAGGLPGPVGSAFGGGNGTGTSLPVALPT